MVKIIRLKSDDSDDKYVAELKDFVKKGVDTSVLEVYFRNAMGAADTLARYHRSVGDQKSEDYVVTETQEILEWVVKNCEKVAKEIRKDVKI